MLKVWIGTSLNKPGPKSREYFFEQADIVSTLLSMWDVFDFLGVSFARFSRAVEKRRRCARVTQIVEFRSVDD
jgi:hypothetical protein